MAPRECPEQLALAAVGIVPDPAMGSLCSHDGPMPFLIRS